MADVDYPAGLKRILDEGLDNLVLRMLLLQAASDITASDTTVAAVLARAGTTEVDDASYTGQGDDNGRRTLDNAAWSISGNTVNIDMDDEVWTSLDDANDVDGLLIYIFDTNDASSTPLFYRDSILDVNGTNVTAVVATNGPFGITLNA